MEMKSFAAGFAAGKAQGGGGGGEAVLINKSVSANGTYNASTDSADGYKKVTVSVPNSYAAGDEGKVVSNGTLVSQTAHAKVTSNGTIDTTLYNSVEVDVSGGGGGGIRTEAWDFTGETPLVGTVQGIPITSNNVSFGSSGAVFDAASDHIDFPFAFPGTTIEVDVSATGLTGTANKRFIMASGSEGLIYRNSGYWSFYANNAWATDSEISDANYFSGSTVKAVIDSSGYWHIYKDGVLVYEPDKARATTAGFIIGSSQTAINSATISAVRISW